VLVGGLLALLGGVLMLGVVAVAAIAVTIWAVADACGHSEAAWRRIGHSRTLWIVLPIGGWLVAGPVGVALAIIYLATVRPRLVAAERSPRHLSPAPRPATMPEHVRLAMRVADADRDRAGTRLRDHFSVGRLSYAEFLQRLDEAYTARTVADLERSLRELPGH
jgi:Domain of unknown function (DUF1707)